MKTCLFTIALCVISVTTASGADEWPQFRGPGGQGHSSAARLPLTWSETENVVWKTPLPGEGHSSPVISGEQIWMTTAIAQTLTPEEEQARLADIRNPRNLKVAGALSLQAIMVDRRTGSVTRQIPLFEVQQPEPKHTLNSYASPTPVIVGHHLYVHFGTYGTACINTETDEVVWKNNAVHVDHQNGPGSSPIVHGDLLIVHFDGIDQQFLAAFSRHTGKVAWKSNRSGEMDDKPEFRKAYGTPLVVSVNGRSLVVSPAANWVYAYDTETGEEVWKAHYGKLGFSTVPRPVAGDGTVYLSTSFMQPRLVAVRYDGAGDVTKSHVSWTSDKQAPKKPSMLLVRDHLYTVTDNGIAACLNTADGSEVWKARLTGDFSASPLYAAGRIYFCGQNGQTSVLQEGAELKELARNELADGLMASPAVAGEALYLRTTTSLYRIEERAE